MKNLILPLAAAVLVVILGAGLGADALAIGGSIQDGVNAARGAGQPAELFGNGGILTTITNTLLFVVGALSVIMIIFGGLRYAVSGGNAASVTAAKNTILYALVGLIIAFLAFAAVNWILGAVTPGTAGSEAGFTNV